MLVEVFEHRVSLDTLQSFEFEVNESERLNSGLFYQPCLWKKAASKIHH